MFGEGAPDFEKAAPKASHQIEGLNPTDRDGASVDILGRCFLWYTLL